MPLQRWEQDSSVIENGIFLGQLAAFAFEGPYEMAGVSCNLLYRLCPWKHSPMLSVSCGAEEIVF